MTGFNIEKATDKFYEVLFGDLPAAKSLFSNIDSQRNMFAVALQAIFKRKNDDERLQSYLRDLGEKHRMLGVQDVHMRIGLMAFSEALWAGNPDMPHAEHEEHLQIFFDLERYMGFNRRR